MIKQMECVKNKLNNKGRYKNLITNIVTFEIGSKSESDHLILI